MKPLLLGVLVGLVPWFALAGEHQMGGFEFDLPGSWEIRRSQHEFGAFRARGETMLSWVKIEACGPGEKVLVCNTTFIDGPTDREFPCANTKPAEVLHANGLREVRKVCSISHGGMEFRAGLLFLAHEAKGLGLMVSGGADTDPAAFLDAFMASVRIR